MIDCARLSWANQATWSWPRDLLPHFWLPLGCFVLSLIGFFLPHLQAFEQLISSSSFNPISQTKRNFHPILLAQVGVASGVAQESVGYSASSLSVPSQSNLSHLLSDQINTRLEPQAFDRSQAHKDTNQMEMSPMHHNPLASIPLDAHFCSIAYSSNFYTF